MAESEIFSRIMLDEYLFELSKGGVSKAISEEFEIDMFLDKESIFNNEWMLSAYSIQIKLNLS